MYKIQDVLIPSKFCIFLLQTIISIVIFINHDYSNIKGEDKKDEQYFLAFLILLGLFEFIEFIIFITGRTLFDNLLNIIQIFLHSVCVLLQCWFWRDVWDLRKMSTLCAIGGFMPIICETFSIIRLCLSNRKITKIL